MFKRNFYIGIVLTSILGCGDPPPPMPSSESNRTNNQLKPTVLSPAWENKLRLIKGSAGQENLRNNLKELTPENRSEILEILNNISDKDLEIRFLQDLASFDKKKQGYIFDILLYLKKRNKELVIKIARCAKCTSIFEKLKMLNMVHDLEQNCQELIEEFVQKLEEDF